MEDMAAWFAHPVYSRYWQHYQQAMRWQQRSRQAYRKALDAAYGSAYPDPYHHQHHQRYDPYHRPPDSHRRYADWQCGGGGGREERASAGAPVEEAGAGHISEEEEEEEEEQMDSAGGSTSDSEIECDVSSMEITDELRQYFAQTEQHRTELKEQQQREAAELESYVLADRDMHAACRLSALPPSDRPGERRSAEMRKLYGENAAKIQGMETAMQLTFDRNCDRKQPKYWPVIPLKL